MGKTFRQLGRRAAPEGGHITDKFLMCRVQPLVILSEYAYGLDAALSGRKPRIL